LQGIDFEWDQEKAFSNQQKHGVSFQNACGVFFDPFVVSLEDETSEGEERYSVVGVTSDWQILYIVYVWRGNTIRLISARLATSHERKRYESGST
jgi:uncharacterized DUF497 family protein